MSEGQGGVQSGPFREDVTVEDIDNALRELDELEESWNNRLTLENLAFVKRYLEGKLDIRITLRIGGAQEHVAVINAGVDIGAGDFIADPTQGFDNPNGSQLGPYRYDRLVFVDSVQFVDQPKGFAPALIGFESVNEPSEFLTGSLYFSYRIGFKFIERAGNRKAGSPCGLGAIDRNGGADGIIKGGAKIMRAIADHSAPTEGDVFLDVGFKSLCAGLRVDLADDKIGVSLAKSLNGVVEVLDVMFGPFDLGADSSKRI